MSSGTLDSYASAVVKVLDAESLERELPASENKIFEVRKQSTRSIVNFPISCFQLLETALELLDVPEQCRLASRVADETHQQDSHTSYPILGRESRQVIE